MHSQYLSNKRSLATTEETALKKQKVDHSSTHANQFNQEKSCLQRLAGGMDAKKVDITKDLNNYLSSFKIFLNKKPELKILTKIIKNKAYEQFCQLYNDDVLQVLSEEERSRILEDLAFLKDCKDTDTKTKNKINNATQAHQENKNNPEQEWLSYLIDKCGLSYAIIATKMNILQNTFTNQITLLKLGKNNNIKFQIELSNFLIECFNFVDFQNTAHLNNISKQDETKIKSYIESLKQWKNRDDIKIEQALIDQEKKFKKAIVFLLDYFDISHENLATRMGFTKFTFYEEFHCKHAQHYSYEFKVKTYNALNFIYLNNPYKDSIDEDAKKCLAYLGNIEYSLHEEHSCIKSLMKCFGVTNLSYLLNMPLSELETQFSLSNYNIKGTKEFKKKLCKLFDTLENNVGCEDIEFATLALTQLKAWNGLSQLEVNMQPTIETTSIEIDNDLFDTIFDFSQADVYTSIAPSPPKENPTEQIIDNSKMLPNVRNKVEFTFFNKNVKKSLPTSIASLLYQPDDNDSPKPN